MEQVEAAAKEATIWFQLGSKEKIPSILQTLESSASETSKLISLMRSTTNKIQGYTLIIHQSRLSLVLRLNRVEAFRIKFKFKLHRQQINMLSSLIKSIFKQRGIQLTDKIPQRSILMSRNRFSSHSCIAIWCLNQRLSRRLRRQPQKWDQPHNLNSNSTLKGWKVTITILLIRFQQEWLQFRIFQTLRTWSGLQTCRMIPWICQIWIWQTNAVR